MLSGICENLGKDAGETLLCIFFITKGFCLRARLHCAPLAHRAIGTIDGGMVRFAPSIFNTLPKVVALGNAIRNL